MWLNLKICENWGFLALTEIIADFSWCGLNLVGLKPIHTRKNQRFFVIEPKNLNFHIFSNWATGTSFCLMKSFLGLFDASIKGQFKRLKKIFCFSRIYFFCAKILPEKISEKFLIGFLTKKTPLFGTIKCYFFFTVTYKWSPISKKKIFISTNLPKISPKKI